MKKIFLMCSMLIGMAIAAHAQGGGRMRMSPADRAKQMQTQLKLTDDQTAKITAIYQAQAARMDSLRTASNGDRDAMRQAMRPMMQETQDKVNAVLNPDQQAAWKKYMDDMRAQRQQNGGGAPPTQE